MAVTLAASPPVVSRYTYRYHLRAEILNSLFAGIFGLSEAVARKSLGASDIEIVILTTASAAFALLAFLWGSLMEGRPKWHFFLTGALLGRGMLVLTAVLSGSIWFVVLCCCVFFADPIVAPAQQSLMQSNYDPTWRGRLLGRVVLWTRGFFIVAALGAGYLLEHDPDLYRLLFPVAGAIGVLAYLQYAFIRIRRPLREEPRERASLGETLKTFQKILRQNRDFDRFERNFFIYGVGFFLVLPANVFLLVDHLRLSYSEISLARLVLFQVTFALFSPLAGRLFDHWKAVRTATAAFTVLALYPICLYCAYVFKSTELVYAGFAIFGVGMAGVNSAWHLGAIEFAGRKDASLFMGVHLTAVGVRGLFVPMIGYAVSALFNLGTVYLTASALFALAALSMRRLARRRR
jgi:MFS family permease